MLSSSEVLLSLLREDDYELKEMAIYKLSFLSDTYWYEMMEVLPELEHLVDSPDFPLQKQAALVCSKIYYHLQSFEDAVNFALKAEDLFDVEEGSLFADTVAGQSIEIYAAALAGKSDADCEKLKGIIRRSFDRCLKDEQYDQALGIALDCCDLEMLDDVISHRHNDEEYLPHVFHMLQCFPLKLSFRNSALDKIYFHSLQLPVLDYFFIFKILITLRDFKKIADHLKRLVEDPSSRTLAYQLAFDVYDSFQMMCSLVIHYFELNDSLETSEETPMRNEYVSNVVRILDGTCPTSLHMQFLIHNSREESQTLLNFAYNRSSDPTCSTAIVIANAFINYGSTCDYLFRHVHDFMSKFTNWSRFIATSSLGLIHMGNESNAMTVLDNYLPKDTVHSSRYAVGGGLFALGLIHLGRQGKVVDYLTKHFTTDQSDVVRHGAALGLGVAAFASHNEQLIEPLLAPIHADALVGEAAAISIGMIYLSSMNQYIIDTLLSIAEVNEHEKTLRGIAIALPLLMFEQNSSAFELFMTLIEHQNSILRWSGMYGIGLAYCGTGDDWALRKLLQTCVTDPNDDVRRAAAISIGFVLYRFPEICLKVVKSLVDSFNPHVRYGSVMALGIAFAGTGDEGAYRVIEPLWDDNCGFVRQGSAIATGMIMMQQTGVNSNFQHFTKFATVTVHDKHESVVSKFGALLGLGVAYAGSGNVSIRLDSDNGSPNMKTIVGMYLFQQFWFWFPMSFFLSMAFSPTAAIMVNQELKIPHIKMTCEGPELDIIPLVVEKKTRHKAHGTKATSHALNSRLKRKKLERKEVAKESSKKDPEIDPQVTEPQVVETFTLSNPSRVFIKQRPNVSVDSGRFSLVKKITSGGSIFVVNDSEAEQSVPYISVPSSLYESNEADTQENNN